jgi:uncharacterized membrane protein
MRKELAFVCATTISTAGALAQVQYTSVPGVNLVAVSADGSRAIGSRLVEGNNLRFPIVWTASGGVVDLVTPPSTFACLSFAMGMSWDGQRMAATLNIGEPVDQNWNQEIVYWENGIPDQVGDLPGGFRKRAGESFISGNGQVVVGTGRNDLGTAVATWIPSTILQRVDGTWNAGTLALATSFDGGVIVGSYGTARAFRWSQSQGFEPLNSGGDMAMALACSADGQVVVGFVGNNTRLGVLWDRRGERRDLSSNGIVVKEGVAVSADGRTVIGNGINGLPVIWNANRGARDLREVAQSQGGVVLPVLGKAKGISADGRTIVGEGFVLHLAAPCAGDVDDGTLDGGRDEAVTIDDLSAFLVWFLEGSSLADIDDGSGTGTPDASVNIDDLLYFLAGYENGC